MSRVVRPLRTSATSKNDFETLRFCAFATPGLPLVCSGRNVTAGFQVQEIPERRVSFKAGKIPRA
jgi:hypothetical protein